MSPVTSPRRKPLQGLFDDEPLSPSVRSPTTDSPVSPQNESPSTAYATLSRLQHKASAGALRSGSGFVWSSAPTSGTNSPAATQKPPANWTEAIEKTEKLDAYVRRIVFQAGLDFETRPMVVLAACCLPDPKEVDYDALLDRIMDIMDLFVENDYTVIYFAGGGRHRPGWNWIWRAYKRLDRKFRKNLKKLYIVHPTFFTRSLLQFVNTGAYFVSPKFSKKVTQLYTLSALAENVPLTQIDIPPEVLQWNTKYEAHVTIPEKQASEDQRANSSRVFGVDLVQLMGESGECGGVPRVVRDCVEAILGDFDGIKPAEVEGIFRRSPSSALLKTAQESYDRGHPVSLVQYHDPHIPAVLLKIFLRSLPRPIFPSSLYALIRACPAPPMISADSDDKSHLTQSLDTIDYLRTKLLPAIQPPCSGILLSYVLEMLHRVAQHSDVNKMDAANLATVIAPNLVSSGNAMRDVLICKVEGIGSMASPHAPQSAEFTHARKASLPSSGPATTLGSILRFCIERYYEIFDETSFEPVVSHEAEGVRGVRSRSSSVQDRGLDAYGGHRRVDSTASNGSGLSLSNPSSPWMLGFTPAGADEEDDRKSFAASRSVTSRDGYRAPGGLASSRGTIGRNSSGSLRLTKGRLGSNTNLRGSFAPSSSSGLARHAGAVTPSPTSASFFETDGLTSQLSGVTLTGANATGMFSSPMSDNRTPTSEHPSSPSSPFDKPPFAANGSAIVEDDEPAPAEDASASPPKNGTITARRRSTRTELSEVVEADE